MLPVSFVPTGFSAPVFVLWVPFPDLGISCKARLMLMIILETEFFVWGTFLFVLNSWPMSRPIRIETVLCFGFLRSSCTFYASFSCV